MSHVMPFRSPPIQWTPGGNQPIDWRWLDIAGNGMDNPIITRLRVRIVALVNTGTNGGPARMLREVIARLTLRDGAAERVSASGRELGDFNHAEYTGMYTDGPNIGASLTNQTMEQYMDLLPCLVEDEQGEDDHGIQLSDLINGGGGSILFGGANPYAATYITFLAGTYIELYAEVKEGKPGKLYPRHVLLSVATNGALDFRYPCNLQVRWLILTSGADLDTQTGFAAQNLTSRDLDINAMPSTKFRDDYKFRGFPARVQDAAGTFQTEDPFLRANPRCVPLYMPQFGQPMTELPTLDSVQVKTDLGSLPSTSTILMSGYTNRAPALEAAALGIKDQGAAQARIAATATVAGSSTRAARLGTQGRRLPVVVR